jgi:hypothetical protein
MGSASLPYPRLLTALRWELTEVPFFFRVCNAATFLREVRALRTSRTMSALVALAAKSRLGPLAIHALQAWRETRPAGSWAVAEPCTSFGAWTDDVWEASRPDYLLCAVRNQETLSCLYPGKSDRLTKLQVRLGGKPIGWAVVLLNDLQDHKYFGRMRLGMIVDCMAPQAYAVQVVQAAAATLQELAVDLIVTNQSHRAWKAAFERSGFLSGPSNYLLGVSREVTRLAGMSQSELVNINRGDGDGITNL